MKGQVARLTPPGRAALASLGLRGAGVWEVARELFHTRAGGMLPDEPVAGRFWLGRLGSELADEVVLAVRSVEPEPWLEVHAHGGREVVALLLEMLTARGLEVIDWTHSLGWAGGSSLAVAAGEALAKALTVRTASILLDQQQGALQQALFSCMEVVQAREEDRATALLEALASRASLGRHLTTPWRVVVGGAPNVGKSSLVNALAGYQRSIVAPTPGTTRDVVTTRLALDGWPVDLADTAGLRAVGESLEEAGIALARHTIESADLCLWVLDSSQEPTWPETMSENVKLVVNKTDLPAAWDLDKAQGAVHVSALTGEGIPQLVESVSRWLVPDPPVPGAGVPFTARQAEVIEAAREAVREGQFRAAWAMLLGLTL